MYICSSMRTFSPALLKNPQLIDKLSKEYSRVIVPKVVVDELDEYFADSYDDVEQVLGITIPNEEDINAYLPNGNTLIISVVKNKSNDRVINKIENPAVILTTGYYGIWKQLSEKQHMLVYYGDKMLAETKFFVTKFLQKSGIMVTAFGDSMNDYYMLKQADKSFLILKKDGTISSSLKEKILCNKMSMWVQIQQ